MINKLQEILDIFGLKYEIKNDNVSLTDEMHFPLTSILGFDIQFLKDKIFNKLYCDLYELIENIIGKDMMECEYDRCLSEILLDLQVGTFLNTGDELHKFKKFYKNFFFIDFGLISSNFQVPINVYKKDDLFIIRAVGNKSMFDNMSMVFTNEVEKIVEYDNRLVLFEFIYHDNINLNKKIKLLQQLGCKCNIEKVFGFTDPMLMVYHLLVSIVFINRSRYGSNINNASIIKIIDELKIIESE